MNLVDVISIFVAFFLAYLIRFSVLNDITQKVSITTYLPFLLVSIISYFVINEIYIFKNDELVKYSSFHLFTESIKTGVFVVTISLLYLNFAKENSLYSRIFEGIYSLLLILIMYISRSIAKKTLVKFYQESGAVEKIIVIASPDNAIDVLSKSVKDYDWRNKVVGIILEDNDYETEEKSIGGYKVLGTTRDIQACLQDIDYNSILLAVEKDRTEKKKWIQYFQNLGKIVHVYIREYDYYDSYRNLDSIGDMAVVSYSAAPPIPKRQLILKRFFDLVLSIILLPLVLILVLVVRVCTNLESKGAVIVPRVRVGKNSIRFYQYRFRVYRHDARERIKTGKSPYTIVGRFLRLTHLDGAPMLFNILASDMSFVGPKAPNLTKYMRMGGTERSALLVKPGVTGYWSLRSELDVIREEDQKYISNWNIFRDISIIGLMIFRYITHQSLRIDGDTHVEEELDFADQLDISKQFIHYDDSLFTPKTGFMFRAVKRAFDIIVSLCALIVLSIPMAIIAMLITIDDGGNPIYKHRRIGKNGRYINIYKFRSMVLNAGDLESLLNEEQLEQYHKEFKIDNDPRITRIGSFIRKTSLDELPQLFNILKGDLSIIGPRPLLEEELLENYNEVEIAKFLSVMPGLTGYWQAYARNNATYETGERQKMEMYYVDHQSIILDIKIFFKTFTSVLKREGAK